MKFDVLIIGLGQIGMQYDINLESKKYVYSHASAFNQHKKFNLIAGVDIDTKLRKVYELNYGIGFYEDLILALKQNKPEVVVIATPSLSHKKILEEVINHSQPRVILCEKPLSYSHEEAKEIQELCKNNNIKLFVNYIRISDPNIIEIKRKINSGEYAGFVKGVVWYSKGLIHNGTHFINLMEYWFGPVLRNECINKGRLYNNQDPEPDFLISFKKGEIIFLSTKEENFSHYTIEMIFENGHLKCDQGCENICWTAVENDIKLPDYKILSFKNSKYFKNSMNKYQLNVTNQIFNYLNNDKYDLCSGTMAINTSNTIRKIIKECK